MTDSTATTPTAAPEPAAAPAAPREPRLQGGAVAVLWAGAAVFSLLSAFAGMYSVSYTSGRVRSSYAVDAWGNFTGEGTGVVPQSGARYAVILCVCAVAFGLLVIGAVGRLLDLPAGPRVDLTITGSAFAVVGLLAGTLVAMYLQTTSTLDNVRTRVRFGLSLGDTAQVGLSTAVDAAPFLALGALACGALAVAGTHWGRIAATETRSEPVG